MPTEWLEQIISTVAALAPPGTFFSHEFNVKGMLAVVLISLICGAVGSLVVGNRMAFFSDALAHCAFAGIALALLVVVLFDIRRREELSDWLPLLMSLFGIIFGWGIAFVRERTTLATDTVIGVFFAGALGFGAFFFNLLRQRTNLSPETFLFGNLLSISTHDLVLLLALALITAGLLAWMYNRLVFASFSASLALSRQFPLRLFRYLFIMLLALIVNLSFTTIGVMLINAMLIVPAATANNLARNLRQMFWLTVGLSLLFSIGGQIITWEVGARTDFRFMPGPGSVIVMLSVLAFFGSMALAPWLHHRSAA
ncbi:MAG: metal ABC transporter permease [Gemmataceae bacterium]|nr:metal ABC transporter permease [Gemmataceae bacterium]MDW8264730.1 metal ABC transporter permease [Gemmataceae bacterium]